MLTTYETLASRLKSESDDFSGWTWFRIILDEAHIIRNPATQVFQLIHRLHAQRRWCLTGTPIQNSLRDLFSIVKFLRITPFDNDAIVRKHILQPLHEKDRRGLDNLADLMKSFSLRRTKEICNILPKREIQITVKFSSSEKHEYNAVREEGRRRLLEISKTRVHESGRVVFQMINRLRQLCSHGLGLGASQDRPITQSANASFPYSGIVDGQKVALPEHVCSSKLLQLVSHISELDPWSPPNAEKPKKR